MEVANINKEKFCSPEGNACIQSVLTQPKRKKTPRMLLHPMTLELPEGCVTAILGPSGSGKSTLLNFITGSNAGNVIATGEVNIQGQNAFVPQDDRLHGFYTVTSYLKHYARLSGQTVSEHTDEKIEKLLSSLGLSNQKDTLVGDIFFRGLSGGQKRRLSVGLETFSCPKNLFLDEPTSGLDSESALWLLKYLKHYVQEASGRRVIITIHQPSSFLWELIDNVVLLSKGKLMYQGSRKRMESFFSWAGYPTPPDYNPADHYVSAVNDEFLLHELSVEEWANKFSEYENDVENQSVDFKSSDVSFEQIQTKEEISAFRSRGIGIVIELTRRYFLNVWKNPGIIGVRAAMYSILALLIGALFWNLDESDTYASIQSRIALQFYCVAFFVFMSVAVLPFTVMERAIVEKEVRNGYYHPVMYQFAQALGTTPGTALLAFLTTIIVVEMTGLQGGFIYFLNMFLSLCCAEALAQLVSHLVPHFIIGIAVVAGIYGMFMLLQGFMLVPSEFPKWLRWTYNIAFHTYTWRSFMYHEFSDKKYDNPENPFKTGREVLEIYEIDDVNIGDDMMVLAFYAIFIHIMSFITLCIKYRIRK